MICLRVFFNMISLCSATVSSFEFCLLFPQRLFHLLRVALSTRRTKEQANGSEPMYLLFKRELSKEN